MLHEDRGIEDGERIGNCTSRILLMLAIGWIVVGDSTAHAAGRESASSEQRRVLIHDGIERRYVVRASHELVARGGRVPLVLVLHGGGGSAANAETMTGFTAKASKEGFLVVYPEGTSRFKDRLLTWNAGHCCGFAMKNRIDDVAFIDALLDRLIEEYPVDPERVFATGISNGGMMAHRLGIELSDRFAGIAPVVAALFGDEAQPRHPVSAIMLNGMLDQSVPPDGGHTRGRFPRAWDGTPVKPALEQAVFWARANGCTDVPEKKDRGWFILWQHRCPAGRAVEMYLIKDNGHAWPGGQAGSRGGDKPSAPLNATDLIWKFFEAHAKSGTE